MQRIEFSEDEIESICLQLGIPKDSFADKSSERRKIIDHWGNANIIACPGSGKTTVLLAKLLLLAKRMPFKDGKGICVLTHTNVAIDEIKTKLGASSKALLEYPNFFGTYQAFAGRFILNKALSDEFESRAIVVDDEYFYKNLKNKYNNIDQFNHQDPDDKKLRGLIFRLAYSASLTIKEIRKELYPKSSNNAEAKHLYQLLKSKKYINEESNLIYDKCSNVAIEDFSSLKPIDHSVKAMIVKKHRKAMEHAKNEKAKIATRLWIDRYEKKVYNKHSELKEGSSSIASSGSQAYFALNRLHEGLYRRGIVGFETAFELSRCFALNNSKLVELFSSRFDFLLCDEMQDSQKHQMDLIDGLFSNAVVRQAYGDPNQAIYSNANIGKSAWSIQSDGYTIFTISDSKRYGNNISRCLQPFKADSHQIIGSENVCSESPCIILYDDPKEVLPLFVSEIQRRKIHELHEYTSWNRASSPFNALGFVGKESENTTISSYSDNYSKASKLNKSNFSNLISYLQKRPEEEISQKGVSVYFDLFISAFTQLISIDGKRPTKTSLLNQLEEKNENFLMQFRLSAHRWIMDIEHRGVGPEIIRNEFLALLTYFGLDYVCDAFVNDNLIEPSEQIESKSNYYSADGIDIKLGTIHSVKGETHMATLLLDTQSHGESESSYFFTKNCGKLFCGEHYDRPKNYKQIEYRLKTTYVAMSRPTHLLCVALKKENAGCPTCTGELKESCKWEIILASKE